MQEVGFIKTALYGFVITINKVVSHCREQSGQKYDPVYTTIRLSNCPDCVPCNKHNVY